MISLITRYCKRNTRLGLAVVLMWCLPAHAQVQQSQKTEASEATKPTPAQIIQALAAYSDLETRLHRLAHPIRQSNADLCKDTQRSIGMTVHTLSDYPQEGQDIAQTYLGVTRYLSIRFIFPGSPAARAGLQPGDRITSIEDMSWEKLDIDRAKYNTHIEPYLQHEHVRLTIRRGGKIKSFNLRPETLCGYPVRLLPDPNMLAYTDGKSVFVSAGMVETLDEDLHLALITAHEMAHATQGHLDLELSKTLELDADRVGLIMMARTGHDPAQIITAWSKYHAKNLKLEREANPTHPTSRQRLKNLRQTQSTINKAQKRGAPLTF